ncbi:MAG: bifunctional folylpolyglutamate synthase/dihydrofolate synthase [Spirosomataceae bacterium]
MNYEQTIEYLYARLPVFHRIGPKAFKADLSNTLKICEHLGNPQNQFKSIHIGGTNGKGSTSHFMASILQEAGYKVGLYTSPHLKDYTERFKINGKSIYNQIVVDFVEQNKDFIEDLEPSFFELSVGLAFDVFAKEKVDIAVVEVGLGGRLDSTNVITPELSIITNIGFDHMDILGDTLPKIASEKAGIIKNHVPVVVSQRHPETDEVFTSKAIETNSEITFAEDKYYVKYKSKEVNGLVFDVFDRRSDKLIFENLHSELIGNYQLKNIQGVLVAVDKLNEIGFEITHTALKNGIGRVVSNTGLKGRWQVLKTSPLVVCDTAHNEHGLIDVLSQVQELKVNNKYFILGFVKDKNVEKALSLFPKDANYIFCQANSPRSMPAENLIEIAKSVGISGYSILNVNEALENILKLASNDDFIYIGGSTFVVAEINQL